MHWCGSKLERETRGMQTGVWICRVAWEGSPGLQEEAESELEPERGRWKCLPSVALKGGFVPAVPLRVPTSKPAPGHHLAAASIDHLQSFMSPIKILSVHITFVFLCWTLLLLHKDTVMLMKSTVFIDWCLFYFQVYETFCRCLQLFQPRKVNTFLVKTCFISDNIVFFFPSCNYV